jgi:uncharacterized protein YeaO (DUF488 family)
MIRVKRAFEPAALGDGARVLVDRLWPRGCSKESMKLHSWAKAVTPSTELRKAFHGSELDFDAFEARYRHELQAPEALEALVELRALAARGDVTLVTANRDETCNHALVLKSVLEAKKGRP